MAARARMVSLPPRGNKGAASPVAAAGPPSSNNNRKNKPPKSSASDDAAAPNHQPEQAAGGAAPRDNTNSVPTKPVLEPYIARLERFELFSTNQCYYLVGCNKLNTAYRVLKMDRTLIERPAEQQQQQHGNYSNNEGYYSTIAAGGGGGSSYPSSSSSHAQQYPPPQSYHSQQQQQQQFPHTSSPSRHPTDSTLDGTAGNNPNSNQADNSHTAKPTLRPLSDFLTEDPNVYSQEEIKDMLDMIHEGNRMTRSDGGGDKGGSSGNNNNSLGGGGGGGGGLKPIVKAYGIVGFIRFLDCYYLTLITRRAKVGSVGDNGIYTIKNTETIPLKPAERRPGSDDHDTADPSSVLLSMWNRGKRSVGLGLTNREIGVYKCCVVFFFQWMSFSPYEIMT